MQIAETSELRFQNPVEETVRGLSLLYAVRAFGVSILCIFMN